MNNLNVTGRLTKDAELSYIKGSGVPAMKFYIAVERKYQKDKNNKKVDYIPCESIGKHGETLTEHMTKGSLVNIIGELHLEPYTDKETGKKLTFAKAYVEHIRLLESRKEKPKDTKGKSYQALQPEGFQAIDDDDIPF